MRPDVYARNRACRTCVRNVFQHLWMFYVISPYTKGEQMLIYSAEIMIKNNRIKNIFVLYLTTVIRVFPGLQCIPSNHGNTQLSIQSLTLPQRSDGAIICVVPRRYCTRKETKAEGSIKALGWGIIASLVNLQARPYWYFSESLTWKFARILNYISIHIDLGMHIRHWNGWSMAWCLLCTKLLTKPILNHHWWYTPEDLNIVFADNVGRN